MQVMRASKTECSSLRRQCLGPTKGNILSAWHCHGWLPAPVVSTRQQASRPVQADVARRAAGETTAPTEAADGPVSPDNSAVALSPLRPFPSPTLLLVGVSLLWGTYTPALRFLYTLDHPPSPALLTALRTVISAASLLALSSFAPTPTAVSANKQDGTPPMLPTLPSRSLVSPMLWAAAQLAIFNFLGTEFQAAGMQATTSTKGAFLGQLTAVITPTLALAAGESVPAVIWAACCLGMVGGVMITLDSSPAAALAQETLSVDAAGPAAILLGCVFYGLVTVQLSKYAPQYDSLQLASAKVVCLAVLSVAWYGWEVATGPAAAGLDPFIVGASPAAWLVLVFSAVGPGALAALLQTKAQAEVSATQAQVIFACTPLWSTLFGSVLLQEDSMGGWAWGGAAVILAATVLPAVQGARRP